MKGIGEQAHVLHFLVLSSLYVYAFYIKIRIILILITSLKILGGNLISCQKYVVTYKIYETKLNDWHNRRYIYQSKFLKRRYFVMSNSYATFHQFCI